MLKNYKIIFKYLKDTYKNEKKCLAKLIMNTSIINIPIY